MKQRHRVLAWALAGALVLAGTPVRAEGNTVYVGGNGSGENSGTTEGSPLSSIYQAQGLLPEGGTILVTSTIYIADEREYSLQDGVTMQAAEGLEGPVFEVAEGGKLTLSNIVIVGNSSTLIANSGVLKLDDSVSLQVKDSGSVGCVYTAEGAATYLNDELVAGDISAEAEGQETEPQSETESESETDPETEETQAGKEPGTESGAEEKQTEKEPGATEKQTEKEPGTAEKQPETEPGTAEKQPETEPGTEEKQPEKGSETEEKQSGKEPEKAETEKKQPETAGTAETETKQPETAETKQPETAGAAGTETSAPVRAEAVETVKNAIVALDIHSREDVKSLLPVSQAYDGLTESEKEAIPAEVRQLLESAKKMAAAYNHTQLGVSVYGNLPWYVQFQVKLTDAGGKEENGQKVLVPYELNLWDMYANSVYTLPEGETVTVTMPVPDVEINGEFTVIHYKSDGTVESIRPVINGDKMSFETSSFSPFTVAGSTVITGIGIGSGTPSGGSTSGNGSGTSGNTGNGSSTGNSAGTGSAGTGTSSGGSTGGSAQTESASGSSTGSSSQTGSTSGGSTGNYNTAVNTGDSTNVVPAAVTSLAALLVIAGILLHRKKGKQ